MKKIIIVIITMMLMTPTLVHAAWWNPLSWFNSWSFSETQSYNETRVLEKRIIELEKKLENVASTTPKYDFNNPTPAPSSEEISTIKKSNPKSSNNIGTQKKANSQIPHASIDIYGMTDADWAIELANIQKFQGRISSNEKYITLIEERIKSLDSTANTVSASFSSQGLDNTARIYAQNYIDLTEKLIVGYREEIVLITNINGIMKKIITAIYERNKDSIDTFESRFITENEKIDALIDRTDFLSAQQESAFDTFFSYFKLLENKYSTQNYTQTYTPPVNSPTYVAPTYVPPIQQYNTNCTGNSYAQGGGTINCTTYAPSSSAIDDCAYIKDKMASQAFIEAAYSKCLQEHSQ